MSRNDDYRKLQKKSVEIDGDKILIVTEGQKTEPQYFKFLISKYNINKNVKILKRSSASDPSSVLSAAKEAQEQENNENDIGYDIIYCVFDRDQHTNFEQVKNVIEETDNFKAIISIPCIEYWFLLHFDKSSKSFLKTGKKSPCDNCISELKKHVGDYKKNNTEIFDKLKDKTETAIKNAELIITDAESHGNYNPSTQVHILVKKLQGLKKKN